MGQRHTYVPTRQALAYTFGGLMPVAHLRSGDVLATYVEDCFGGLVRSVADLPSRVCTPAHLNPVTGPFFVEGAEPGDTLAVHFLSITPTRSVGVSSTVPHLGPPTSRTGQPPPEERVWLHDIDAGAGVVRFRARGSDFAVHLPLDPMHGTVGVAPGGFETRSSVSCGAHGGKLHAQLRAGTTLYLGVNVDGAMLAIGDGIACRRPSDPHGVPVAVATRTVIAVEVIKGVFTPWPRIESDDVIGSVGCARSIEDALQISQRDVVGWTSELTGLDTWDAHQLVAQAGTSTVGNLHDPNFTATAQVDKALLGDCVVYTGAHRRLRSSYRRQPTRSQGVSCDDRS
jgi:acetamidase/formamidase